MTRNRNTSRRSFIKTASAAGAGLFLPYHFSAAPTLAFDTGSPNDKVNIGLIGAGGMGGGNINSAKEWLHACPQRTSCSLGELPALCRSTS